jgi:hypothetical protein
MEDALAAGHACPDPVAQRPESVVSGRTIEELRE